MSKLLTDILHSNKKSILHTINFYIMNILQSILELTKNDLNSYLETVSNKPLALEKFNIKAEKAAKQIGEKIQPTKVSFSMSTLGMRLDFSDGKKNVKCYIEELNCNFWFLLS